MNSGVPSPFQSVVARSRAGAIGRAIARLRRDARGVTAVEFALVATPLFLLLFGVIEFGRLIWTQSSLHYAVESAARCAAINTTTTCTSASTTASYAAGLISGTGVTSTAFTPTYSASGATVCTSGTGSVTVSATYTYQLIVNGLFPAPTLTASSTRVCG